MNTPKRPQIKKRRIIAGALAFMMAVAIFVLSSIPAESYPAHPSFLNYVAHFGEYFIFAGLLTVALTGGRFKPWQAALLALVIASAYGASDELHQYFVPGRMSDPMDWLTDTLGAAVGAAFTVLVLKRLDART